MNIFSILLITVTHVIKIRRLLFKGLLIPFLLSLGIQAASFGHDSLGLAIVLLLAGTVVQVVFLVTIYRVILLGETGLPKWPEIWGARETSFLGHYLGLLLILVFFVAATFQTPELGLLWVGLTFWVLSRLLIVLPAIAIDRPMSFVQAWVVTKHDQLLVLSALVLSLIPFSPAILLPPIVAGIFGLLAQLALASVLSVIYHALVDSKTEGWDKFTQ